MLRMILSWPADMDVVPSEVEGSTDQATGAKIGFDVARTTCWPGTHLKKLSTQKSKKFK